MQRRDFLKGVLGTAAAIAAVHLALPEEAATQIIEIPKNRIYTRTAYCRRNSFGDYQFHVRGGDPLFDGWYKNGLEFEFGLNVGLNGGHRGIFTFHSFAERISELMDAYLDPYELECRYYRRRYVPKTKPIPMSVQAAAFYLTLTPRGDEDVSQLTNHIYIPQQWKTESENKWNS